MAFDFDGIMCSLMVLCVGIAMSYLSFMAGEYPSSIYVGGFILFFSVVVIIFMLTMD